MKKVITFISMATLLLIFTPNLVHGGDFGPEEWNQYRLNNDKNAVFDNGSNPLEYKEFETEDEVRATPVIVGNHLYIGNHNTGDLFAFDIHSGEKLWQNQAPNWIHSEMIYHDGKVYVGMGNRFFQEDGIRGTGENGVLAIDAETGEILWKYNTDGEVMPTPAYYDDAIYIATGDRHLYKLDPDSGELLHKEEIGSTVSMSSPNITGDTLYVGGSGPEPYTFSAYDLTNDEFKWQTEYPDVFAGLDDVPPAVSDNLVVTTALKGDRDSPEHMMYVMDTDTGDIVWEKSLGTGEFVKNNKSGAPIIYEGTIYVGSPITKTFYAYDLGSGEKLWEFEDEVMKAPPVAQDGVVYFSNTKGFVYAMDVKTGEELGSKKLNGKLAPAGPIIVNNTLFVGSQDSNIYAVPLTDFGIEKSAKEKFDPADDADTDSEENNNSMLQYVVIGILIIVLIGSVLLAVKKRR